MKLINSFQIYLINNFLTLVILVPIDKVLSFKIFFKIIYIYIYKVKIDIECFFNENLKIVYKKLEEHL